MTPAFRLREPTRNAAAPDFARQPLPELAHQPCLAHSRVAENRHQPRTALLDGGVVHPAEAVEFLIAADERTRKAAHPARPHQRERPHKLSRHNAFRFALRIVRGRLCELKGATRRGDGAFADEDRPGGSSLLQASSNIDRVAADEGASRTSLPDDYIARVDADAQLELPAEQLGQLRTGKRRRADQVREQHSRQLPLLDRPLGRDRGTADRAEVRVARDLRSAPVTACHAPIVAHEHRIVSLAGVHALPDAECVPEWGTSALRA